MHFNSILFHYNHIILKNQCQVFGGVFLSYLLTLLQQNDLLPQATVERLLTLNASLNVYALSISQETAIALIESKQKMMFAHRRFELNDTLLEKIITVFADSPYFNQEDMIELVEDLMDIFLYFKAECSEAISDSDLLYFMKKAFDGPCSGSTDLLANISLQKLCQVFKGTYLPDFND